MAHPIANIIFEVALGIALGVLICTAWEYRGKIIRALRIKRDRR
jgi:hypothetical protein